MAVEPVTRRVAASDLVDLHTHSVANDGLWEPRTLAQAAANAGIRVVSLTDHDTMRMVPGFLREAREAGLVAVPGVEVSCWWRGAIHHVLLYNVDQQAPELQALLNEVWAEQLAVAAKGRAEIEARGFALPYLETERAGREVLPIHVLVAALRAGIGRDFMEVVRVLVNDLGISFAAGADLSAAVAAGHAAGGVAMLAHPGRAEFGFTAAGPEDILAMIEASGLDGIEVYHWSHGPAEVELYGRLAADRRLLVSCGSDSHGPQSVRRLRGWEARLCRDLLERCGVEVTEMGE